MDTNELTNLLNKMNSYRPLDKEQVRALEQDTRIEHVWSSKVVL